MNTILYHLKLWFSIEAEPLILTAVMCLFGAYVLTQILKNVALGIAFYPVLLLSAVVSIGIGMEYGLVGYWYNSMAPLLAAICIGMSLSTLILLAIIAVYNHSAS
jgi:hypothetical protein